MPFGRSEPSCPKSVEHCRNLFVRGHFSARHFFKGLIDVGALVFGKPIHVGVLRLHRKQHQGRVFLPRFRPCADAVKDRSDLLLRHTRHQLIRPACTIASRTAFCAFSDAGTIGSRTEFSHLPISDIAYLIGAGLVSMNRFWCNGESLS